MTCQLPPVGSPQTTQVSIRIDGYENTFESFLTILEDPKFLGEVVPIPVFIGLVENMFSLFCLLRKSV